MTDFLKKLLRDERMWCVGAFVQAPSSGGDHYSMVGPANARQVMVHVISKTTHAPMWAHLSAGSRDGSGVWRIPDIGTEVMVEFGDGDADGDAMISGVVGRFDATAHDLMPKTTLIIDESIEARSKTGIAELLALKSDLATLKSAIQNAPVSVGDGGATFKAAILNALIGWPIGTSVLKGE